MLSSNPTIDHHDSFLHLEDKKSPIYSVTGLFGSPNLQIIPWLPDLYLESRLS